MAKQEIRPIRVEGQVAYVPLTKGYEAIIDAADVPLLGGVNWYAWASNRADGSVRAVYAVRAIQVGNAQRLIHLHRVIMETPEGLEVDHIDGNGLNNQRSNLRNATRSQNLRNQGAKSTNTSGRKGVSLDRQTGKWRARIWLEGKNRNLGSFNCPTAAALAYARASRELHGEFGRVA